MVSRTRTRFSFVAKLAGAAALIAAADLLFYGQWIGSTLGLFALLWIAVLTLTRPDVRRHRGAQAAILAAGAAGLALVDDPGPLDSTLFWTAIATATLLPQHRFTDALSWGGRLLLHGVLGMATPVRDLARLRAARRTRHTGFGRLAAMLAMPVIGSAVFLLLFAFANPLIGNALLAIQLPDLWTVILHALFWTIVLLAIWPNLRPRGTVLTTNSLPRHARWADDVPLATLILSLIAFNAVFALQNALDLAFLWSGGELPAGVSAVEYAHRGAYPLIATALLAAAFVLITTRSGSAGAGSPLVRRLVVLWVAQNVLLVASSILRTVDLVRGGSLTPWRISALAWMGLVAAGLLLIVWRMLRGHSAAWLINANALAAAVVLVAGTVSDLETMADTWNVRHATRGDLIDFCYLHEHGVSALIPLIELERRAGGPVLRDRMAYLRSEALKELEVSQQDWHGWTRRGARRLAAAREMLGEHPRAPRLVKYGRLCSGAPNPPPEAEAPTPAEALPPTLRGSPGSAGPTLTKAPQP